jgi:hypothetical protein
VGAGQITERPLFEVDYEQHGGNLIRT